MLIEAVLASTHNLCFEQKENEKVHNKRTYLTCTAELLELVNVFFCLKQRMLVTGSNVYPLFIF